MVSQENTGGYMDLTEEQKRALFSLLQNDENIIILTRIYNKRPKSNGDMAKTLKIDAGTCVDHVNILIGAGLV